VARLAFEDFAPGSVATHGGVSVSRDDIVAFARAFDPQPFHLDEAAARDTFAGELIGSGWHACALLMRMIADGFLLESTSQGAPGIDEVRWLKPMRPGDRLRVRRTVLDTRESRSRPDIGFVRFRFEVVNGADETILEQVNTIMFGRRGAPPPPPLPVPPPMEAPVPVPPAPDPAPFFDDVEVGTTVELGAHRFDADGIKAFARQFDPQRFHVDERAARESLFGGLCASGWHTAAVWMRLMVAQRRAAGEAARALGSPPARLGPSPGFRDLKWLKPVYAGDVVSYRSTVVDKRASASRPGWGLVFNDNEGVNGRGEPVFRFRGCVFWERRV
jgi:acyl dehydratase